MVVVGEARELVPVVVDGVDQRLVRPRQRAFELQIVGRVGEDQVDAGVGKLRQLGDAVADEDLVEGESEMLHPKNRRGTPGTRDLNPGFDTGCIGTRGTHGAAPLRNRTSDHYG